MHRICWCFKIWKLSAKTWASTSIGHCLLSRVLCKYSPVKGISIQSRHPQLPLALRTKLIRLTLSANFHLRETILVRTPALYWTSIDSREILRFYVQMFSGILRFNNANLGGYWSTSYSSSFRASKIPGWCNRHSASSSFLSLINKILEWVLRWLLPSHTCNAYPNNECWKFWARAPLGYGSTWRAIQTWKSKIYRAILCRERHLRI